MMPFGIAAPLAAWLALLALPVVAFYFLKLKRPQVRIPSLALWQQVLNDSRVNSPFQRFKRNLLLWLQLLLLLLLVLAAMQPFVRGGAGRQLHLPILIDVSASMAGRRHAGGPTRLEEARGRAAARIERMVRGQQICLIAVGRTARRLTDFTDNKRVLLAALDALETEDVPSHLGDALRMAQAMGRATAIEEVLLLSDGNLPPEVSLELPFALTYDRLEVAGANAGITSLRAVRAGGDQWRVFVGIDASAAYRGPATLEAFVEGVSVVRELVSPMLDQPERVAFELSGRDAARLEVRLTPDGFDALEADNVASLQLPALRPANLYVPESLPVCRRVIASMDDVLLWPGGAGGTEGSVPYDAVISPSAASGLEAPFLLTIGSCPQALTGIVERVAQADRVVDWQRGDPLLQHVALADVALAAGTRYTLSQGVAACEERGYDVVIHGERGPLMVRREVAGRVEYALLVKLEETTLPYRVALPVMLANFVRLALQHEGLSDAQARHTGVVRGVRAAPGTSCSVRLPGGGTREMVADPEGRLPGLIAGRVGTYRILGGATPSAVDVALLSPLETELGVVDQLRFSEVAVTADDTRVRGARTLWPLLAFLGFLLLLVEWWFFHRIGSLVSHGLDRTV